MVRTLVYILFGAAFTSGASYSAGRFLLARLRVPGLTSAEQRVIAFLGGSALLSLLTFLLCAVHLALKGVFLVLGLGIIFAASRVRLPQPDPAHPRTRATPLFLVPIIVFGVIYFINALAPEVSPDGSSYHLAFVNRYWFWHGFRPITTNMYANMPQGMEMLFLFAFVFGRYSAAALVHLTFLFALAQLIWSLGQRWGKPNAGLAAAACVFTSPIFGIDASSAYNDVALAATAFGCFFLLNRWRATGARSMLIISGLLAGFAFGLKYTGVFVFVYAVMIVLTTPKLRRQFAALATPAALLALPWVIKSYLVTGNPFSPFFNTVFPNPYIHVSFEHDYSRNMRHAGSLNPIDYAWGGGPGGTLGSAFLLAPLALLALRNARGRQLWLGTLLFALMFPFNTGTRFLMSCAPLLALLICMEIPWAPALIAVVFCQSIIASPAILNRLRAPGCWSLTEIPLRAALRIEPDETFIRRRMPHYDMTRFIEETVPAQSRVLALDPIAEAYTTKTALVSYQSAEGELERDMLFTQPGNLLRFTFPAQALSGFRVINNESINEISVKLGDKTIHLDRVSANPQPWDARLTIDDNLATRWSTWRPGKQTSEFAVHFAVPQTIDTVELRQSGQDTTGLALELSTGARLTRFEEVLVTRTTDLRRLATAAIRARGTEFLMVPDNNAQAAEFLAHRSEWNMVMLGHWGNARLYRLQP